MRTPDKLTLGEALKMDGLTEEVDAIRSRLEEISRKVKEITEAPGLSLSLNMAGNLLKKASADLHHYTLNALEGKPV